MSDAFACCKGWKLVFLSVSMSEEEKKKETRSAQNAKDIIQAGNKLKVKLTG